MKRVLPLLLLFAFGAVQAEEFMYIDDKLTVTLRTGQGNQFKILRVLESGERVEILERDGDYVRVRGPKGMEGWMRAQYLTDQPIARDRLVVAEQKIAALQEEREKLRAQLKTVQDERSEARKTGAQLEKDYTELQKELAKLREVAAAPIKLHEENQAMRARLDSLENENAQLRTTNEKLRDDAYRDWFLTGAGVLAGGILLGLVLPKMRRRRSSWGSDF
ncbi:MAG: TIGR04211 family SH3 domain-containing protein [Thiohalomonadaceae bacterium]